MFCFSPLGGVYNSGRRIAWELCLVYFLWCKTPEIQQSLVHAPPPAARKTALWIKSPERWWWLVNTIYCPKTRTATEEPSPHGFIFLSTYQKMLNLKWLREDELVGLETHKTYRALHLLVMNVWYVSIKSSKTHDVIICKNVADNNCSVWLQYMMTWWVNQELNV